MTEALRPVLVLFFIRKGKQSHARENSVKLINSLARNALNYTLAVSLGHVKALIEHSSSMTHCAIPPSEKLKGGIEPGGFRISVGLEEPDAPIKEMVMGLRRYKESPPTHRPGGQV